MINSLTSKGVSFLSWTSTVLNIAQKSAGAGIAPACSSELGGAVGSCLQSHLGSLPQAAPGDVRAEGSLALSSQGLGFK